MRLATVIRSGRDVPVVIDPERGLIPVVDLLPDVDGDLLTLIRAGRVAELFAAAGEAAGSAFQTLEGVVFTAPYRHPRMIWGIGLNYVEHASDLAEAVPQEPASFIKGDHTVIGPGEGISLPQQSERTTSEAEMGLVIGRYCRNVSEEEALDHVLGVVPVLDQTAEDILGRNPRFLTRAKNFPGFFSFGPQIVPLAEVIAHAGGLGEVQVSTVVGEQRRSNTVANMRFAPAHLVSFHSTVMPMYPGDILSPGTPGAIQVRAGDVAECHIPGVGVLTNPVVQG